MRYIILFTFLVSIIACGKSDKLPVYFENEPIPTFKMQNQAGKEMTEKDFTGKIYIADFFFSTCPGICKIMAKEMKMVQNQTKDMEDVKLISFSVDPETDSVARLKEYGEIIDAIPDKWHLMTGKYENVFDLAQKKYHISALKDAKAEGGIFHDERLILVDKKGRVRGFYHIKDSVKMKQLIVDIGYLRTEKQ